MTEQLKLGMLWERWRELDALVLAALESPELTEHEKEVLRVIAGHKGSAKAVRAREIAQELGLREGEEGRRFIAGVVETAILLHGIPIGAIRFKPYGYFLIASANDLDLAIAPLWGEVYAHLRRLRMLAGKQFVARMFGQAMLKLDVESGPTAEAEKPQEAA
jgi:hypothetical protein